MATKKSSTKERMAETINELAVALYDIAAIDAITLRELSSLEIPEVKDFEPQEIKKLRLSQKVSQSVFALLLNTSVHTVRDWEQGKKHPHGAALKLLNMVANNGIAILVA
jgi:putative transcriptional regulator